MPLTIPDLDWLIANEIKSLDWTDAETATNKTDELVCELLKKLGCDRTAEALKNYPRWFIEKD